jgi:hypothetical protein
LWWSRLSLQWSWWSWGGETLHLLCLSLVYRFYSGKFPWFWWMYRSLALTMLLKTVANECGYLCNPSITNCSNPIIHFIEYPDECNGNSASWSKELSAWDNWSLFIVYQFSMLSYFVWYYGDQVRALLRPRSQVNSIISLEEIDTT